MQDVSRALQYPGGERRPKSSGTSLKGLERAMSMKVTEAEELMLTQHKNLAYGLGRQIMQAGASINLIPVL